MFHSPWLNSFKRFPPWIPREPVNPDLLHKQRDHLNVNQTGLFDQSIQSVLNTWRHKEPHCEQGQHRGCSWARRKGGEGGWNNPDVTKRFAQNILFRLIRLGKGLQSTTSSKPVQAAVCQRKWRYLCHSKHHLTFLDHTWPLAVPFLK